MHTVKSTLNNFDGKVKQICPWLVDVTIADETSYREAIFLQQILVERIGIKKKSLPIHAQSIDIQHSNIFIRRWKTKFRVKLP